MAYLQTPDGKQVYYESHGAGATAVLLIHGWGMSLRVWDNVLPALRAAGHRVVMLDHRGCGQSDKDFADMGIAAIAADVVSLVAELELESVVLNGWSLGGAVAVEAATALGKSCSGLVLTCAASPIYVRKPDFAAGGTQEDMAATLAAMLDDRVTFLHGLAQAVCMKKVGPAVVEWMWREFCRASPMAFATLGQLEPLDQRAQLAALRMPILSFVGTGDVFVDPQICRWVGDHNPGARVVEFEGVGHAPFLEVAADYNRELLQFLSAND